MAIRVSTDGQPSHIVKDENTREPIADVEPDAVLLNELVRFLGWLQVMDADLKNASENDHREAARLYLGHK